MAGELDGVAHLVGLRATRQAVRKKQHVELAALQGTDHGFPVLALIPFVTNLLARIDPRQRHMRSRGKEREAGEMDLLGHNRILERYTNTRIAPSVLRSGRPCRAAVNACSEPRTALC